jgi:hypothetical protein
MASATSSPGDIAPWLPGSRFRQQWQCRPPALPVRADRSVKRLLQDQPPLDEFEGDVLPSRVLFPNLITPGRPAVGKGRNGVDVPRVVRQQKLTSPAVVLDQVHLGFLPVGIRPAAVLKHGGNLVVAVLEDIRADLQHIPHHTLDGIAPAIDLGLDALDDDAAGGCLRSGSGG